MGPYLAVPKKEKETENGENAKVRNTNDNNFQVKFGACGMQGWRNTMEDSHIAFISLENVSVFGVFDGHGGKYLSA